MRRERRGGVRTPWAGFAVLLVGVTGLVALALWAPPVVTGDGGEYLLMTESLYRHGSPSLRDEDVLALRGLAAPRGLWPREAATRSAYFEGADGRLYAWHFWGYSLLAVPARALLAGLGADPLRALPLTNALCLAAMTAGAFLGPRWPRAHRALFASLALFSPVLPFLCWTHPEVFVFAAVVLSLAVHERAPRASLAYAALASAQAPPLLLLVLLLWARLVLTAPRGGYARRALGASAAALPALLAPSFFLFHFSTPSLAATKSFMHAGLLSIGRALDLALDLEIGLLPHTPGVVLLAVVAAGACLAGRRWWALEGQLLATAAGIAIACTYNDNWNNATSGPSRYALWLLPLLLYAVAVSTSRLRPMLGVAALAGAAVLQAVLVLARGGPLAPVDYLVHSAAARVVFDRWPALYDPGHEIFVERTTQREDDLPPPPYVYRSGARCRKALLRRRFAAKLESLCGPIPPDRRGEFFPRPRDAETRNEWVYVSW